MAREVSFRIKVDDNGGFRRVTMNAEELSKAVGSVQDKAEQARRAVLTWSEAAQAIDVLQSAIGELQGVMTDLTQAYQVQLVAETQLDTIMRQRMGATSDMVQSVKDLCSAQQELGVIGDEVQLSGAQQMATFLKEKQSLDVLIPAMNNLLAQQNGLNATNQDAVSIGNMMGKAMQGQVEVLQRVGVTFDESQKKVLQFGTESERAAVLAQVITDNVGNMNAVLAQTDAGKQKQLENTLGDIKEQMGQLVQGMAPYVTMASQITITTTGVVKLTTSLYAASRAWAALGVSTLSASRMAALWNAAGVRMNALVNVCSASMRGAAVSAGTLRLAIQGLMIATGVGVAVAALTSVISYLASSSDDAADSTRQLTDAELQAQQAHQQEARQIASVRSEMDLNIARLKNFSGSKEQEKKLVQDMNAKYGEALGYYSTVSQWYQALTANSKAYCNQMINEIRLRNLADKAADLMQKQREIRYNADGSLKKYSKQNKTEVRSVGQVDAGDGKIIPIQQRVEVKGTSQLDEANRKLTAFWRQEQNIRKEMAAIVAQGNKLNIKKVDGWSASPTAKTAAGGGKTAAKPAAKTTADNKTDDPLEGSIDWYQKKISDLNQQMEATADASTRKSLRLKIESLQRELDMLRVDPDSMFDNIKVNKPLKPVLQKIDEDIKTWTSSHGHIEIKPEMKGTALRKTLDGIKDGWNGISGVGDGIQSITDSLKGNKNAWQALSGVISGVITVAEGIQGVIQLIDMLTLATQADTAASAANATAKGGEAIAGATASGAKLPFPANLIAIAAGVAAVVAALGMISGAFADGGIVGGNSTTGDKLLARVNSGEMILNSSQQARLFAMANGTTAYGAAQNVNTSFAQQMATPVVGVQNGRLQGLMSDGGSNRHLDISLKVRGRDLVAAVANETRSNSRRSNIR